MVLKRPFNDNVFISAPLWKIKKVVAKGFTLPSVGSCQKNSRACWPGTSRSESTTQVRFSGRMKRFSKYLDIVIIILNKFT